MFPYAVRSHHYTNDLLDQEYALFFVLYKGPMCSWVCTLVLVSQVGR